MKIGYDQFTEAFLAKITEYNFLKLEEEDRQAIVDGYMRRAVAKFREVCVYDIADGDGDERAYTLEGATQNDADEIIDIVTDGMVLQWLNQYLYKQENLENALNTVDFTHYSPAELTYRITNAHKMCKKNYIAAIREYSFRHGDLTRLHI